ncbi:M20/M25/M40 family metallo-hydrolase [Mesobaculum littorinae]|uniref:M20/M25/M40 family metallo-hydrolase n=1 Tax=Mesobaculum littorinae TaxID=2486419 RepID=A0A438ALQ7_9RHOB|nr:M20/M25/M40 family metallo-hydrolase [Mesobaculum littorinae]RVV99791.1 M20/M25/M40 family metallo-hydrolase [Mesobaculum littorinae]
MTLDAVLSHIDAELPNATDRLLRLLRIPSISTDPAYAEACETAADWLVEDLRSLGFEAEKRATPGRPMVVGHGGGDNGTGGRHVLFYGHYDVQPVDPLNLWHREPFDPEVQDTPDGRVIRGRGASDDKGQLMTFVEACRAMKAAGVPLPRITFLFEGEEESGSPSLVPFLEANAEELKADVALICDTSLFAEDTPGITTMLRGLLGEEITIRGPERDLHSGFYGGPAINPIRVLSKILATLHDDTGRITVPGFYDGVPELTDELRDQWQALGFDDAAFLGAVGLSQAAGEEGRSVLEQIWSRPTAEINGIWGGYTGAGFKTVLPAEAHAKVSFRLVGTQDPHAIRDSFRKMVEAQLPEDCSVEFHGHGASQASVMNISDPAFEAAREALSDEWPNEAAYIGAGGSIPIAGYFKSILGMDSMLIGFGRDGDQIHSPNEKYDMKSFHKGTRSWARILDRLA